MAKKLKRFEAFYRCRICFMLFLNCIIFLPWPIDLWKPVCHRLSNFSEFVSAAFEEMNENMRKPAVATFWTAALYLWNVKNKPNLLNSPKICQMLRQLIEFEALIVFDKPNSFIAECDSALLLDTFYWNIRHFYGSTPSFVISGCFFEGDSGWLTRCLLLTWIGSMCLSADGIVPENHFVDREKESGSEIQCSRFFLGEESWSMRLLRNAEQNVSATLSLQACHCMHTLPVSRPRALSKRISYWWWSATGFNAIIQPAPWWEMLCVLLVVVCSLVID